MEVTCTVLHCPDENELGPTTPQHSTHQVLMLLLRELLDNGFE